MEKAIKTAKTILKYVKDQQSRSSSKDIFQFVEKVGSEISLAAKMCFPVANTFKRIISGIR